MAVDNRPCLLNMPAVLKIAFLKILRCAVGVHFVSNCVLFLYVLLLFYQI